MNYTQRRQVEGELMAYRYKQAEIPTDPELAEIIGGRIGITLTFANIARLRKELGIKSRRDLQKEAAAHKRNGAASPSAALADRMGLTGALETLERKQVLILEGLSRVEKKLDAIVNDFGVKVG